jgi:hypothetical protein
MQSAASATGGLTTTLDIAALVSAIVWPLLLVIAVLMFGDRLVEAVKSLAPRVKSISIGAFSFELAAAQPLALQMTGAVDLRHAGQSGDVNDSTLRSFYEQIADPTRLDYAVVDLGDGNEWLTSRLFILSIILSRMRGLRAFVFVETAGHVRRRFVGVGECEQVRWRLAMRFPWLEAAVAQAEAKIWPKPLPGLAAPFTLIANEQGRLEWPGGNPEPAADLLRAFLDEMQLPAGAAIPASGEWETLPGSSPPKLERAQWLTAGQLEQIMGTALDQSSVRIADLHMSDDATKAALLVAQSGRWIALTREDRVFDRLIDRARILETIAARAVQAAAQ